MRLVLSWEYGNTKFCCYLYFQKVIIVCHSCTVFGFYWQFSLLISVQIFHCYQEAFFRKILGTYAEVINPYFFNLFLVFLYLKIAERAVHMCKRISAVAWGCAVFMCCSEEWFCFWEIINHLNKKIIRFVIVRLKKFYKNVTYL